MVTFFFSRILLISVTFVLLCPIHFPLFLSFSLCYLLISVYLSTTVFLPLSLSHSACRSLAFFPFPSLLDVFLPFSFVSQSLSRSFCLPSFCLSVYFACSVSGSCSLVHSVYLFQFVNLFLSFVFLAVSLSFCRSFSHSHSHTFFPFTLFFFFTSSLSLSFSICHSAIP